MSNPRRKRCAATTKAGTPCKNYARPDSDYCGIHQKTIAATSPPRPRSPELEALLSELNQLADDLRQRFPDYEPPPYSSEKLLGVLKETLTSFTPEIQLGIVQELRDSFQGATVEDFLDPETWKGMWYVVNYVVESEGSAFRERVLQRLESLPGGKVLTTLHGNLESVASSDFFRWGVWKDLLASVGDALQNRSGRIRRRVMRGD